MYEDMTFENIMDSMMEDMPDGLDTSEGSLIYHSCVKQAARLEEVKDALFPAGMPMRAKVMVRKLRRGRTARGCC